MEDRENRGEEWRSGGGEGQRGVFAESFASAVGSETPTGPQMLVLHLIIKECANCLVDSAVPAPIMLGSAPPPQGGARSPPSIGTPPYPYLSSDTHMHGVPGSTKEEGYSGMWGGGSGYQPSA